MAERNHTFDQLYTTLFPADAAGVLGRLAHQPQWSEERIVKQWWALCRPSFAPHSSLTEQLFQDFAVPNLRAGTWCAARGDVDGFITFARTLGEQLARARIPFVAFVGSMTFLRKTYANALQGQADEELRETLLLIDNIHSCLVSVAADSYYARLRTPHHDQAATPADAADSLDRAMLGAGIVGRSAVMRRVVDQVVRIAGCSSPVLVLGETGTGKELVARAVHQCGPRADGPFLPVNCAALPRELVESELFGYQRGAFSGAVSDGLGLFRAAEGGTLFLDEITEMHPDLQAKLLRVLQESAVRPVGAVREVPIDVRVIASTNRDPEAMMAAGLLRPDLYYRLSVSTIRLPALRARREDIAPLVAHFLGVLNGRHRREAEQPRRVGGAAVRALEAQPWPGNVRELFNVIENAFTMCRDPEIAETDLGLAVAASLDDPAGSEDALRPFEAAERDLIARTLAATGGNKLQAARDLGISRTKLYAKITKYRLTPAGTPGSRLS